MCVPRIVETVACLKVKVRRLSQFGIESRKGTYGHAFPSKGMAPGKIWFPTRYTGHPAEPSLQLQRKHLLLTLLPAFLFAFPVNLHLEERQGSGGIEDLRAS